VCSHCGSYDDDYSEPYEIGGESSLECSECGHKVSLHTKYGCEYTADRWVSGKDCDGLVAWECGCKFELKEQEATE
jgi:hypothetical protein